MSIGAGWPKFNTWSTMSAGWKKNCSSGYRFGSSRRSMRDESAVGVCFSLSEMRISPSMGPTVAESLSARLMPL